MKEPPRVGRGLLCIFSWVALLSWASNIQEITHVEANSYTKKKPIFSLSQR